MNRRNERRITRYSYSYPLVNGQYVYTKTVIPPAPYKLTQADSDRLVEQARIRRAQRRAEYC